MEIYLSLVLKIQFQLRTGVIRESLSGAVVKQLLFYFIITDHVTKHVFVTVFCSTGMQLSVCLYVKLGYL
jgi:hypothetical protein